MLSEDISHFRRAVFNRKNIGALGVSFYYNKNANSAKYELNKERYARMVAEENYEKAKGTINTLKSEINRTKTKLSSLEVLLEEEKFSKEELQKQFLDSKKANDKLNKRIKELESMISK